MRYKQKLGFDPSSDLDRVVLAVTGGDKMDFLVLLRGHFLQRKVLAALARHGHSLKRVQHQGQTLFSERESGGTRILFPGREGLMVGVSKGWTDIFLSRLSGKGRSVLQSNMLFASQIRTQKKTHAVWIVSHLAPGAGRYLAHRTGLSELHSLLMVHGSVKVDSKLWFEVRLQLGDQKQAKALKLRLGRYIQALLVRSIPSNPIRDILKGIQLEQRGANLRARLLIGPGPFEKLFPSATPLPVRDVRKIK